MVGVNCSGTSTVVSVGRISDEVTVSVGRHGKLLLTVASDRSSDKSSAGTMVIARNGVDQMWLSSMAIVRKEAVGRKAKVPAAGVVVEATNEGKMLQGKLVEWK